MRLISILVLAAFLATGLPAAALADTAGGVVSIAFANKGQILPRRSHQKLALRTINVQSLDVAIRHVGEGDTLAILGAPDAPPPAEAALVWQGQINVQAALDQPVTTGIDVLGMVGALKPGLYHVDVHESTGGMPQARASRWIEVSNIGIEALQGADGIAIQAHLLSEATQAANIEVALIARNNRELARVRTDNAGLARFNADATDGQGADAPAAIYAYGAEGEFTALSLAGDGLLPLSHDDAATRAFPLALIRLERSDFQPGDVIHGMALLRGADGRALSGTLWIQVEDANGRVAEVQQGRDAGAGGYEFTAHAPPIAGEWIIRAYRGDRQMAGWRHIAVGKGSAAKADLPAAPMAEINRGIVLSPGRRSFQPGEIANISVQPMADADVTIAMVNGAVHEVARQKIGKEGGVVQLPIPSDAHNGVYVLAEGIVPPDDAAGRPAQRLMGLQWLEIDKGPKRMGVRLDVPEHADANARLPVKLSLSDIDGQPGYATLVGTDASEPPPRDPLEFFYGRRSPEVKLFDTYGGILGATEPASDGKITPPAVSALPGPSLVWTGITAADKSGALEVPVTVPRLTDAHPQLRLSALSWSEERVGFNETVIDIAGAGKKAASAAKSRIAPSVHPQLVDLTPNQTLRLAPGEAAVAGAQPPVAIPVAFHGEAPVYLDPEAQSSLAVVYGMLDSPDARTVLETALLSLNYRETGLYLSPAMENDAYAAVQGLLKQPDLDPDLQMLAHYVLLRAHREGELQVAAWLTDKPRLDMLEAKAARIAIGRLLGRETPRAEKSFAAAAADEADLRSRAFALYILADAGLPWPAEISRAVSQAIIAGKATPLADIALRMATVLAGRGAHKALLSIDGAPVEGNAILNQKFEPIILTNSSGEHAWILQAAGLADTPPTGR